MDLDDPYYLRWTTADEMRFVDGLGFHRASYLGASGPTREMLLRQYLTSMEDRAIWGEIDPARVRLHVLRSLEQLAVVA